MVKYIINGGKKLAGKISISGNKNSILPCLSACLLTSEEVTLTNVPRIFDVQIITEILKDLGANIQIKDHTIKISCKKISTTTLEEELVKKLRASVLLAGPLLARTGRVEFNHPGGDVIGRRSIETHLQGFHKLGYDFEVNDTKYKVYSAKKKQVNTFEIFLEEPSVTATENLIMCSVLGPKEVILKNCAKEPHVIDLCHLLTEMGAKIEGAGESTLKIKGVPRLHGTKFRIGQDFLEVGTYSIAAAITKSEVQLVNCSLGDMEPIIVPLTKMGVIFEEEGSILRVKPGLLKAVNHLKTNVWPGFPTDMMSVMIVLATQAKGVSLLHDWMYESRMFFVDKLINMGASITIADPHRVVVYGPSKLTGRELETPDIRAGMALVLAALCATGTSVINKSELIERGYENVVGNLLSLGADIKRVEN